MNGRFFGLLACLLLLPYTAAAAQCFRGPLVGEVTYVRDGDTIEVGGLPIRLQGLAAPEGDEQGGTNATEVMSHMVLGRGIRCELDGERAVDRRVGSATSGVRISDEPYSSGRMVRSIYGISMLTRIAHCVNMPAEKHREASLLPWSCS